MNLRFFYLKRKNENENLRRFVRPYLSIQKYINLVEITLKTYQQFCPWQL